ncbi:MAG: hypothetical protein CMJ83_19635 [Planctomycetes bacterium]|nr:hypothetical protein [Planctomycetota bacterium]
MRIPALFACITLILNAGTSAPGQKLSPKKTYPAFTIGVTGIEASIEPGFLVTVQRAGKGTPGDGLVVAGDVILAAGGRALAGPDPRVALGTALTEAEAKGGRLGLRIRRDGRERNVQIRVPILGPYGKTWPRACPKSRRIVSETAAWIASIQADDGGYRIGPRKRSERDGLQACLLGLFLLSTGEDRYLENVARQARALAKKLERRPGNSSWQIGYQGILLAEYFLRTGDRTVRLGLRSLCQRAVETQVAGSWGHSGTVGPGYVQSGLMNSAAVPVLTLLALGRECGVGVDEAAFQKSLRFFFRMAGHGCVCYGDHRAELFPNTNGRNSKLACALSLIDDPRCQAAAQHLATLVADSYYAPEFGHTGGGFNVMWRGMGSVHVPTSRGASYRRQMDRLSWYFDLTRLPAGGFSMLPTPPSEKRYTGVLWGTGAVALNYTAALKTLRITGAPRTRHAVTPPKVDLDWGAAADRRFLSTADAAGFGQGAPDPDVVWRSLFDTRRSTAEVGMAARHLLHYSPMVRTWAARVLAQRADEAAIDALANAAAHRDPRVRRAAFDAVSGYDNWGRATHPGRRRGRIPADVASAGFLPAILKTLRNRSAAWWEIDGALWALGRCKPEDVRRNLALVRGFARHREWYLREASYWAQVGLGRTINSAEFVFLARMYAEERHVFVRSSYDAGFQALLRGARVKLDPPTERRVAAILGKTLHSAPTLSDYGPAGQHEVTHRTMMVLKHFPKTVWRHVVKDAIVYLKTWTPESQHAGWLITGSKWQPGLLKVLAWIDDRKPALIEALRGVLRRTKWNDRNQREREMRDALRNGLGRD